MQNDKRKTLVRALTPMMWTKSRKEDIKIVDISTKMDYNIFNN